MRIDEDPPLDPLHRVGIATMTTSTETLIETDDPWGAHASAYDTVFAPLTGYIARSLLAMTEARLPPDARVVDIACGSGALLLPAIEHAQRSRAAGGSNFVVGCDFSAGMVAEAQRKASRSYEADVFRCEVQNGQALVYDDASFDAAFSCFRIFLFDDRIAGWAEAARVLKPGGVFATTTWMAPEHNEMFRAQFAPIMDALPARLKEERPPPGWMLVAEAAVLEAEVEQAGFVDVDVRPFHTTFVLPSIEVAWHTMLDNPAGGALLRQCNEDERTQLEESFARGLRAHAGGSDHPIVLRASCNTLTARRG